MDFTEKHEEGSANLLEGLLLTRFEAAKVLGVSERTLDAIRKRGELPSLRVGLWKIRIRSQDLEEYLLRRLERENPQPPSRN